METITFAKLVENAVPGTELVRSNWKDEKEYGIWTGKTWTFDGGRTVGYVYNKTQKSTAAATLESETDWSILKDSLERPLALSGDGLLLAEAVGAERTEYVRMSRQRDAIQSEFDVFKRNAQEQLAEWATSELSDEKTKEFSELLESIGLEGIKREYTAHVLVTYAVEFQVTASSEDDAREEVDNNLGDYIYDAIDVSYWEDYSIDNVEES